MYPILYIACEMEHRAQELRQSVDRARRLARLPNETNEKHYSWLRRKVAALGSQVEPQAASSRRAA